MPQDSHCQGVENKKMDFLYIITSKSVLVDGGEEAEAVWLKVMIYSDLFGTEGIKDGD